MSGFIYKISSLFSNKAGNAVQLLFFSLLVAAFEVIGVVAIMPFVSIASDISKISENEYLDSFYIFFNFSSDLYFVIAVGISLILFYIFKGALNIYFYAKLARISRGQYSHIAQSIFKNFIDRKYLDFFDKTNASLSKSIVTEAQGVTTIFISFFLMVSELLVFTFLVFVMFFQDLYASSLIFFVLLINIIFIKKTISKKINAQGVEREKHQKDFYSSINTSFGNFKISKLSPNMGIILKKFNTSNTGYAKAQIKFETLVQIPRVMLEILGFSVVILLVLYLLIQGKGTITDSMPIITMFVLSLYRLLPAVNRIVTNYNNIEFYSKSLDIVIGELNHCVEERSTGKVIFNNNISLDNVGFFYKDKIILNEISLSINKGDKVAFIGKSGSGKSTLSDVIMGLHLPKSGKVLVDGVELNELNIDSWRHKIGYIPQHIYLFEGTVLENICFGRVIDVQKAEEALKRSNILDFLNKNYDGIYTQVGDFGIKLSGGQKQRVAIARALYGDPEVLILDEATSALDVEIEKNVMDEIYKISKNKTLIIVAHRLSTIKDCDVIYKVNNKKVELVENKSL